MSMIYKLTQHNIPNLPLNDFFTCSDEWFIVFVGCFFVQPTSSLLQMFNYHNKIYILIHNYFSYLYRECPHTHTCTHSYTHAFIHNYFSYLYRECIPWKKLGSWSMDGVSYFLVIKVISFAAGHFKNCRCQGETNLKKLCTMFFFTMFYRKLGNLMGKQFGAF